MLGQCSPLRSNLTSQCTTRQLLSQLLCGAGSRKDNVRSTVVAEKQPKQKKYNFRSPAPPPAAQSYLRGSVICRRGSLEGPAPPQSLHLISPVRESPAHLPPLDLARTLLVVSGDSVGGQWLFLFMGREWRGSPSLTLFLWLIHSTAKMSVFLQKRYSHIARRNEKWKKWRGSQTVLMFRSISPCCQS